MEYRKISKTPQEVFFPKIKCKNISPKHDKLCQMKIVTYFYWHALFHLLGMIFLHQYFTKNSKYLSTIFSLHFYLELSSFAKPSEIICRFVFADGTLYRMRHNTIIHQVLVSRPLIPSIFISTRIPHLAFEGLVSERCSKNNDRYTENNNNNGTEAF